MSARTEDLLSALGLPARMQLLDVLLTVGEATPTVLARHISLSRQALTKHLLTLNRAQLVTSARAGREVRYRVDLDGLDLAACALADTASDLSRRVRALRHGAEHAR